MAEMTPNVPPGASPLRPSDSGKVQPKKETVRINLPPKPTASPTIKLPTLPAASAAGGASAAPAAGAAKPAVPGAPKPPAPPTPGAGGTRVAGGSPSAPRPGASSAPAAAGQRPAPAPAMGTAQLSTLDKVLAISAAVVSLGALGCAVYLAFFLTNQPA